MEKIRLDPPDAETCIVELTLRKDLRIYHTQLLVESGLEDLNFSFVPQSSDSFRPWESMFHTLGKFPFIVAKFFLSLISKIEEASEHHLLL